METGTGPQRDVTSRPVTLRRVDLDTFFNPRRVAVVGASDAPGRPNTSVTQKVTAWAERRGAAVHYVNPNRAAVAGRPALASLGQVGAPPDLVAVLVGDPLPVLRDAVAVGARFAVVFTAGFAETGAGGARLQDELERIVAGSGLHVLGPNTNLNAFEAFRDDLPGRAITLITQSGHQGRPVFQGQEIGIRLSHWAPTGNEADLEAADFIDYFSGLESTGVVACYIEGFKDGRTLQLAADAAARRKVPVVVVKVGRTDAGASMAKAHTGHLTGSDAVVSSVFRQYGMQRVDELDQLLEVSAALARTAPPGPAALRRLRRGAGGRVCVYSISGGTGAHMADLVAAAGLELPSLTPGHPGAAAPMDPALPPRVEPGGQRRAAGGRLARAEDPRGHSGRPPRRPAAVPHHRGRAFDGRHAVRRPSGRGAPHRQAGLRGLGIAGRHGGGVHEGAAARARSPPSAPSAMPSWRPRPTSTTTASWPPTARRSPGLPCARPRRVPRRGRCCPRGARPAPPVPRCPSATPRTSWRPTASPGPSSM